MSTEAIQKAQWVSLRAKHPLSVSWYGVSQPKGTIITITRQGKAHSCMIEDVQVGDCIVNDLNGESYQVREVELVKQD
jgi:hypothetical protein